MAVYNPKSMYADDFINHEEILKKRSNTPSATKIISELIDSLSRRRRVRKRPPAAFTAPV